jgi:hypothetical protein
MNTSNKETPSEAAVLRLTPNADHAALDLGTTVQMRRL